MKKIRAFVSKIKTLFHFSKDGKKKKKKKSLLFAPLVATLLTLKTIIDGN